MTTSAAIVGEEDVRTSLTSDNCITGAAPEQRYVPGERSRRVAHSALGTRTEARNSIPCCRLVRKLVVSLSDSRSD